jgi:hypothetical protein
LVYDKSFYHDGCGYEAVSADIERSSQCCDWSFYNDIIFLVTSFGQSRLQNRRFHLG